MKPVCLSPLRLPNVTRPTCLLAPTLIFVISALTLLKLTVGSAASLRVYGGSIQVFSEVRVTIPAPPTSTFTPTPTSTHTPISTPTATPLPGQSGTSLEATKSAEGFLDQSGGADRYGVRGQVCAENVGDIATENLAIFDQVQYKIDSGQFQNLEGATANIVPPAPLQPGEKQCYPYEIVFVPIEGATYRNGARVTITNHSGWLPGSNNCPGPEVCPYGPNVKASFVLPTPVEPSRTPTSTATPTVGKCKNAPALLGPPDNATVPTMQVGLDWSDLKCAAWYEVVVKQGSTGGKTVDQNAKLAESQYTTKPLATGQKYYWRMRGCSEAGCGPWSGYWSFQVVH